LQSAIRVAIHASRCSLRSLARFVVSRSPLFRSYFKSRP